MLYERFEIWLNYILNTDLPEEIVAFAFNIYEEENDFWSVELVGTSSFDDQNDDWACEEVFDSREYSLRWQEKNDWETIHSEVETCIRQYLVIGNYAELLKEYWGIGMGFVDGDLSIIYQAEKKTPTIKCPECGKEIPRGVIKVQETGGLLNSAMFSWYPDGEEGKLFQKNAVSLRLNSEGYYCDECMKVFATFEERLLK